MIKICSFNKNYQNLSNICLKLVPLILILKINNMIIFNKIKIWTQIDLVKLDQIQLKTKKHQIIQKTDKIKSTRDHH